MSIYGGAFKGRRATVADQNQHDNTALRARQVAQQAKAQNEANNRFNAEMAFKTEAFEYNKQQSLIKQKQFDDNQKMMTARYDQEFALKKRSYDDRRDDIQFNKDTDADRYADKRSDLEYNKGIDERNFALKERQLDVSEERYNDAQDLANRKFGLAESKIKQVENTKSFLNEINNVPIGDGLSIPASEKWKMEDPNLKSIYNSNGSKWAMMEDGSKMPLSQYSAQKSGIRSSGGGSSRGRAIPDRRGGSTRPQTAKPFKTNDKFFTEYMKDANEDEQHKASRVYDSLSRNYNMDEKTAQSIAPIINSLVTKEGFKAEMLDSLSQDAVRKLDLPNAEKQQLLMLTEAIADKGIQSKREQFFKGKPWMPSADSSDTKNQYDFAESELRSVLQYKEQKKPAMAQAAAKDYLSKVKRGEIDNSSAQMMVMKALRLDAGMPEASKEVFMNLQADIKELEANPQYEPFDKASFHAVANSSDGTRLGEDELKSKFDGMIVSSMRRSRNGGTKGTLTDILETVSTAQSYIASGKHQGSEDDLAEKEDIVAVGMKTMASFIKRTSGGDSNTSMWLAEMAFKDINKSTGMFDKLDLQNKTALVNEGAKNILMKTLRSVALNEGADKVDVSDILSDPKLSKYHKNIGVAKSVLERYNDDSVVLDDIQAQAIALNPSIDFSGDIKLRTTALGERNEKTREALIERYGEDMVRTDRDEDFSDLGHFEEKYLGSESSMDDVDTGILGNAAGMMGRALMRGVTGKGETPKSITHIISEQVEKRVDNFREKVLPTLETKEDLDRFISLANGASENLKDSSPSRFSETYGKVKIRQETLVDYIKMAKFKLKKLSATNKRSLIDGIVSRGRANEALKDRSSERTYN